MSDWHSGRPVVLLTGFEPFGGARSNPSWDAARQVAERWAGEETVRAELLPVTFDGGPSAALAAIDRWRPDVVVILGLHGGARELRLEQVAVNLADARIPDNDGAQPHDEPVVPGAPPAYFSTLPVRLALDALHEAVVPAAPSLSAGAYVCNATFYAVQHALAGGAASGESAVRGGSAVRSGRPQASGFVHVPPTPGLDAVDDGGASAVAGVPLSVVVRGVEVVVRTTLDAAHRR